MNLGFLWLDIKVDKKKTTHFSFNIILFIPKNEILNSVKAFLALILFHYYFLNKKLVVPHVRLFRRFCGPLIHGLVVSFSYIYSN